MARLALTIFDIDVDMRGMLVGSAEASNAVGCRPKVGDGAARLVGAHAAAVHVQARLAVVLATPARDALRTAGGW